MEIKEILKKGSLKEKRALFSFTKDYSDESIILKFNIDRNILTLKGD